MQAEDWLEKNPKNIELLKFLLYNFRCKIAKFNYNVIIIMPEYNKDRFYVSSTTCMKWAYFPAADKFHSYETLAEVPHRKVFGLILEAKTICESKKGTLIFNSYLFEEKG